MLSNEILYIFMNKLQIEILYWLINNALSYPAASFENTIVMILCTERGIKENHSGLITQMYYLEIDVLQNSITTDVIY